MTTRIHDQEKEQFKKLFRQEGIDKFEDRFKVLGTFLQTEKHVTLEELTELLEKNGYYLESDFISETLTLLCRYGFAEKIQFDHAPVRYEHRHLGQHHDHMICTKCGKIIEFNDDRIENLQIQAAAASGFHMLQHKLEIYGICSECVKTREELMPLVMARQGERFIIKDILGGSQAMLRLVSMGLRLGDELEVISSHGRGQMVVSVDCGRYVLGRGFANKIMVKPSKLSEKDDSGRDCGSLRGGSNAKVIRLSEMKEGQSGRIVRVGGSGILRRRILEMGVIKGTEIYIEKYAPLKDPLELIVKGYHISLRVEEAAQITVDNVKEEKASCTKKR